MANTDNPNGFKPIKYIDGTPWNGEFGIYYVASTDSTAIYKNDFVTIGGSADTTGRYPTVAQSAAGDTQIVGSVVAFGNTPETMIDATDHERDYRPASTAMYLGVVDGPDVVYEGQEDGTSAVTVVGRNMDIIVGTGSTTTGLSAMELDSSTATAAAANCRLLRYVPREDNEVGANARFEFVINEHYLKTTSGL